MPRGDSFNVLHVKLHAAFPVVGVLGPARGFGESAGTWARRLHPEATLCTDDSGARVRCLCDVEHGREPAVASPRGEGDGRVNIRRQPGSPIPADRPVCAWLGQGGPCPTCRQRDCGWSQLTPSGNNAPWFMQALVFADPGTFALAGPVLTMRFLQPSRCPAQERITGDEEQQK